MWNICDACAAVGAGSKFEARKIRKSNGTTTEASWRAGRIWRGAFFFVFLRPYRGAYRPYGGCTGRKCTKAPLADMSEYISTCSHANKILRRRLHWSKLLTIQRFSSDEISCGLQFKQMKNQHSCFIILLNYSNWIFGVFIKRLRIAQGKILLNRDPRW